MMLTRAGILLIGCFFLPGHAGNSRLQVLEEQFKEHYHLPAIAWPLVASILGHDEEARHRMLEGSDQIDEADDRLLEFGSLVDTSEKEAGAEDREEEERNDEKRGRGEEEDHGEGAEGEEEGEENMEDKPETWDIPEDESEHSLQLQQLGERLSSEEKRRLRTFLMQAEPLDTTPKLDTHQRPDITLVLEHLGLVDFENVDGGMQGSNGTSASFAAFWADAKAKAPPVEVACGSTENFYATGTGYAKPPIVCMPFDKILKKGRGCTYEKEPDVQRILKLVDHKMLLAEVASHAQDNSSHATAAARRRRRRRSPKNGDKRPASRRRSGGRRRRNSSKRRRRQTPASPVPSPPPPGPPAPPVKTGCVPKTEWKPVPGSEDCASRGVKRRDEMPGFEPFAHFLDAKDLMEKGSKMCGKVCPRKYLIAQYWQPPEVKFGPAWESYETWCASRAVKAFGAHAKAVSFFRRHQMCEVFSACPEDKLEDAKDRAHMQVEEICPSWYETDRKLTAENNEVLSLPVDGFCYMKPNPKNVAKKCDGTGNTCLGKNQDVHSAVQSCLNQYGRYDGMNSKGLHVCFFDAKAPVKVKTFVLNWGNTVGRKSIFKEHSKCNTKCGQLRSWHMNPMGRYSRFVILPKSMCGKCRAQRTFCSKDEDGYTSWNGMTYGPTKDKKDEADSTAWGDLVKGPDFTQGKRNHVCCQVLDCERSIDPSWKDDADGKKPCEENPGNINIANPFGTSRMAYGTWKPTKIQGHSAPNAQTDGNTCFQTHKHFRPHPDFFDWHRTGKSSRQYCYPRMHEVAVAGSEKCEKLKSVGQCLSNVNNACKWNAPETQGECRAKVVPGSEKCESPTTTCPGGKPCQVPSVDSGCDYPSIKEAMEDLPISRQGFTKDGKLKTHVARGDIPSDVQSWSGVGARPVVNTTWFTLQEHGWKGSNAKCVTRVYPVSGGEGIKNGNVLGLACKARPIDHPKLSWNGEPCNKASTSKECSAHSEICDWKPGPKCDIRHFHEISFRCVACKDYAKQETKTYTDDGRLQTAFCKKCVTWQQYFSKYKSELACHILEHFYGLGPEITSRIDVHSPAMDDHGNSPDGTNEFLFDGKRTCVMATAASRTMTRGSDQKNSPKFDDTGRYMKMKPNRQVNATSKAGYVCEGGSWLRYPFASKTGQTSVARLKRDIEWGVAGAQWGPYYFVPCNPTEATTRSFSGTGKNNFYETLEALAEAIKAGGRHPECPANSRPMPDAAQVGKEQKAPAWKWEKPCSKVSKADLGKRQNVASVPITWRIIHQGEGDVKTDPVRACHQHPEAKNSKDVCESFYEMSEGDKQPCIWVPDSVPSPYGSRCIRCGNKDLIWKNVGKCSPNDSDAPKECPAKCVLPLWWPSRHTYTLFNPCTRFLNIWGFCGCSDKHKSISTGGGNFKGIDCRGCNDKAVGKMRGDTVCENFAPLLPPALCLALKALGVSDSDIVKITRKAHWQHGMEYHIGKTPSCVAAGEPQHSCVGVTSTCWASCPSLAGDEKPAGDDGRQCHLGPGMRCSNSLWCSGNRNAVAQGLLHENSNVTGGQSYGSWGAQAQQLRMAFQNGGEHPSCPRQVTRPDADPCFQLQNTGKRQSGKLLPSQKETRVCDSDCEKLPKKCYYDKKQHKHICGPAGGLKCGLRFMFPALLGPDATLVDSNQGQFWGSSVLAGYQVHANEGQFAFWQCQFAGYNLGPAPKWGPDGVDAQYLAQDYSLYRTEFFGRGICSENRREYCDGVSVTNFRIPGCRSDMWPRTTCAGGQYGSMKVNGSACVCGDMSKKEDEANTLHTFDFGVDTCHRGEARQEAFECIGDLAELRPGESLRWGFRCKADQTMLPYAHNKLSAKMPCPPGVRNCGASNWNHKAMDKPLGRFSPGSGKVKACVRPALRCNGFCNCGDCSDEEGCEKTPSVLGVPWRTIGWDTTRRCPRSDEKSRRRYPKGVISCNQLDGL